MRPFDVCAIRKVTLLSVLIGFLAVVDKTVQGAVVYEQSDIGPIDQSGAVVSTADGYCFADDWPAVSGSEITKVTWWIQEFNGVAIGDFRIRFLEDNNGVPGQVLYGALISASEINTVNLGQIQPTFGLYELSANLPSAFEPSAGTTWISIGGVSNDSWRALLGDPVLSYRNNTHAQASSIDGPWETGGGVYDLAFRLEDAADDCEECDDCGTGALQAMPFALLGLCNLKSGFGKTRRKRD